MVRIDLEGMDKLQKELQKKVRLKSAVATVIRKNTAEMQQTAIKKAPSQTGNLRRSIKMKCTPEQGEVAALMYYAPYVEYGTRFMLGTPYLRPALAEQQPKFKADIEKLVKK